MNTYVLKQFRRAVSFLLAPLLLVTPALAQQTRSVDVYFEGPRPVAKAIYELTRKNYQRVTYEDPRYQYPGDVRDVTEEFRNPLNTSRSLRRTLIPVGGSLSVQYSSSSPEDTPDDWGRTVRSVVDASNAGASGGRFRVLSSDGWLHVVPWETRDDSGTWVKQASILDTPITIEAQKVDGPAALTSICKALSEVTGQQVIVGVIPLNTFAQYVGEIDANNEPARDVLMELFDSVSDRIAWQIFYTPDDKWYVLNAFAVAPRPEVPSPLPVLPRPGDPTPAGPAIRPQPID